MSKLGRCLPWGGGEGPSGQGWRRLCLAFLLCIVAFSSFSLTGTAGLTPFPPSGSLTSSTSVPMRECYPSKGGAEDGICWGGGPLVLGLVSFASCIPGPGPRAVRSTIFSLHSYGASRNSVQPQPKAS